MQGVKEYEKNGVHVLRIHYSADPDKRTDEWKAEQQRGMSKAMWDREYEIKFDVITGKAWFAEFRADFHVAAEPLGPIEGRPVFRGWDYGLTPATVFAQTTTKGQLIILYPELQSWDSGITAHGLVVRSESATYFPGWTFIDYGDPAGNTRSQNDEKTANDILREKYGINVQPGPVAELARHEAIRHYLTTLTPDGAPMLLIDPRCTFLIRALGGGYQHRCVADKYLDVVADNEYTHIVDGLGYMAAMINGAAGRRPWNSGRSKASGTL
ncbi:MAG: hypothetical protein P4N59_25590 [Negativicutes bacterium]|nr:hypothetical protein [Negativicutes bacterium]